MESVERCSVLHFSAFFSMQLCSSRAAGNMNGPTSLLATFSRKSLELREFFSPG